MLCRNIIMILFFIVLLPAASATTVLVNSDDWIDVYSSIEFAHIKNYNSKFMTTKRYAAIIPQVMPKSEHILIIESQKVPFTVNLAATLKRKGYSTETIYASGGRATNIELAKKLDTRKYIVVDPSYGYNAISVTPYAQLTDSYVIFADQKNIDQVATFLNQYPPESLLLYGSLDSGVVEKLSAFSPEVIDKGNRYKNNIEIIKKYMALEPQIQLVLTDGSIIEDGLMKAGLNKEAILLIGRDSVPEETIDFVKNSNFRSAVVVGNHLSRSGKYLKDATGVPVFLRFGQGVTRGTIAEPVKALDMFPLPVINLELIFRKAQYNTLTKTIEITFDNVGMRAFTLTSAGILVNGVRVIAVGDKDVQRVESNKTIALSYPADLTEYISDENELTLDLFTLYGEDSQVLDHAVVLTAPLPVVKAQDRCEISVKSVQYNKQTQRFMVKVENDGPVDCFVDVVLKDVIVEDQAKDIEYAKTVSIDRHKSETVQIKQRMTEVDIADNPTVQVHARYGEREGLLISLLDVTMPVRDYTGKALSTTTILLIVVIALLIIVFVMFVLLRKKKRH